MRLMRGGVPCASSLKNSRLETPVILVMAGLAKLRKREYHREPLSKELGGGLFELRHVGKLNTRVLWFFMKGRRIIGVHGIRNKSQAIAARDLDTARERMRDWLKRETI